MVVELGAGTGANLRYIPRSTRLIAVEPNPYMHRHLLRRARELGREIELLDVPGEAIDLPDASVDMVFCSLVLCTVEHPEAVMAQVRRILRPGGSFACIEHVRAPCGSGDYRLQRLLDRPWRWLFEGCHLCRDTASLLRSSGFAAVELEAFRLDTAIFPVAHQIQAHCRR